MSSHGAVSGAHCSYVWEVSDIGKHTFIIRKVVLHRTRRKLFLEAIDLVEEEDDGCLDKPSAVAD